MKPLIQYCSGVIKAIQAQYETTAVIGHNATSGSAREKLILDFLVAHTPQMTNVLSGVIFDSFNNYSKQQDIVLVQRSMPRLPFANGCDLIFQEGVAATFEIKTNIQPSTFESIGENIQSIKRLKPSSLGGVRLGELDVPRGRILCSVLTYGGGSFRSISERLESLPEEQKPDIYFDLSKGILIKNESFLLLKPATSQYQEIPDPAEGLAHFLRILIKYAGTIDMKSVKWEDYIYSAPPTTST